MGREETLTWKEAVSLLEITPPADADAVRRTYLRRVKKVRPERDPDGFRRLREAFELLRWGVHEDVDHEQDAWDEQEWEAEEAIERSDDAARVEATETEPPEPHPAVVYEPPAEYRVRAQIWEGVTEASDAAEAGDLARARYCLEAALDLAEEHSEPGSLDSHTVIETVLRLYAGKDVAGARQIYYRYTGLLERTGTTLQVISADLGARVLLLREIGGLPDDVPSTFHAVIADGILDDDPVNAAALLAGLADTHPLAAITVSDYLATRAPALDGLYGEVLRRTTQSDVSLSDSTVSPNGWVWVVLGVALIRLIVWLVLDDEPRSGELPPDSAELLEQLESTNSPGQLTEYDGVMPGAAATPEVARQDREAAEYATATWRLCEGSDGLCQSVREIQEAAELGRCEDVRRLARDTHALAYETKQSLVHELDTIVTRARRRCWNAGAGGDSP